MFTYPSYLQPLPYYSLEYSLAIIRRAQQAREAGKKIVIASGVFDLLHEAHQLYLQKAKEAGGYLIVLIESDIHTRELKGEGRPIWNEQRRETEIKKLSYVDDTLILPPEFKNPLRYEEIVILLAPHVYAESSNSTALDHKRRLMEKYGGCVDVVLEEIPGVSTTQTLANAS